MTPLVVIVTGPPCAGKTTLALRLAEALRLPRMTKDVIKESLFDTLGVGDADWSGRLGGASMELLYVWVGAQLAAGRSCLVEANFRPDLGTQGFRRLAERYAFVPVIVNLHADPYVLAERWNVRRTEGIRHPGHRDAYVDVTAVLSAAGRLEIPDIGGLVIEIDTTTFEILDLSALVMRINAYADAIPSLGKEA